METIKHKRIIDLHCSNIIAVMLGTIALAIIAIITGRKTYFPLLQVIGYVLIVLVVIGSVLLFAAWISVKKDEKKRRNIIIDKIGNHWNTPIQLLIVKTGLKRTELLRELDVMTEKGMLPKGRLDYEMQSWIIDSNDNKSASETFSTGNVNREYCPYCGDVMEAAAKYCVSCGKFVTDPIILHRKERYTTTIRALEKSTTEIAKKQKAENLRISIERMYDRIEKSPEDAADIQTFLDIYLPKMIKVIDSYLEIKKNGNSDERVDELEVKLEKALDDYIESVDEALKKTYKDDLMDTLTDMEALEHSLIQEGLLDDEMSMMIKAK